MTLKPRLFSILAATALLVGTLPVPPVLAQATPSSGSLVKGSQSTVYYLSDDGGRYYFPNSKIYFTWYENFDSVISITDAELATYPLKGNVSYKAGRRLIKIESDPKVYAVDSGARLRWVPSEARATNLFGSSWAQQVDDIPVSFFTDYLISEALADVSPSEGGTGSSGVSYDPTSASNATPTINENIKKRREYRGEQSSNTTPNPSDDPLYQGGSAASQGTTQSSSSQTTQQSNVVQTTNTSTCGNGIREGLEECDGSDLNSESCSTRSFNSGTLSCSSACVFVTASCSNAPDTTPPSNPDIVPPSVSLTAPASGANVNGTITLNASATDDSAVASVTFKIGDSLIATDADSPYSTTYSTILVANGTYALYAIAKDTFGNDATSTRNITISNPDVTSPIAAFSTPAAGATLSGSISITATATDNIGISSVQFRIGSTTITTDTTSPYSATYDTSLLANGSHTLTIIATDAAGNTTTVTRGVTVSNVVVEAPSTEDLTGLVARYEFSAGSGSSALDTSGNSRTGTINGATWTTSGHTGNALNFDGTNDYVNLGGLDVSGSALTLSAWFNSDNLANCSPNNDCRILAKSTGVNDQDHYWMISTIKSGSDTRLRFRLKAGGTTATLVANTGNLSNGTWYHTAVVYDGSQMKIYLNGELVGSDNKTGAINTSPSVNAWIGGTLPTATTRPWDGKIDDVRIYSRALSASEVAVMAGTSSAPSPSPSPSPTSDTVAPTVSFTAPTAGATVSGIMTLAATASDNVGVASVQFRIGSTTITTDTTSPYSATYNTAGVANGSYTLTAIVTDTAGNTATATRSVTINNAAEEVQAAISCPSGAVGAGGGTVYYVCDCGAGSDPSCVAGNDANNGTSPATPWKTYGKARTAFGGIQAGDTIAFCRGGRFQADSSTGDRWVNSSCQANNRCIVRDYTPAWGSAATAMPIVNANGVDAFAFEDGGNAEHEEGVVLMNLALEGNGGSTIGVFFYNDIDDVLMCGLSIDRFRIGVSVSGSNAPSAGSDAKNARIVLRDSRVTNSGDQGWLGACDGCTIEDNEFENNGFARAIFNHNIYLSGDGVGERVAGNTLYRSTVVDGQCQGVSLVVHGIHDGLVIENNLVKEDIGAADDSCWGIAVDTGYGAPEAFRDLVIRGNTVMNVGGMGIGINACEDCVIENNVLILEQSGGTTGIRVPDRTRASDDLPMSNVAIRNNSIYMGPNTSGEGIYLGGEGTGHVVVNNAIHYAGSGSWSCFELNLGTSAYAAMNHNACYFPNTASGKWEKAKGSLSAWRTATGFSMNAVTTNPGFIALSSPYNLRVPSSSPLVGAGHTSLGATTDRDGVSRGANPDIGAYEQ